MRISYLSIAIFSLLHSQQALAICQLYGVHDQDLNDTQFFSVDMESGSIQNLGDVYRGYDIEGLAINPATNTIIASAGDHGTNPGMLYQLNPQNGELITLGDTGYAEIDSLSFDPSGQLWGWSDGTGLLTLHPSNDNDVAPIANLVIPADDFTVSDLTWSLDGKALYLATGSSLLQFDTETVSATEICNLDSEIESLETYDDGKLLLSFHDDAEGKIRLLDLSKGCQLLPAEAIQTGFNDIEGIAYPYAACQPPVQLPDEDAVIKMRGNMGCIESSFAAIQYDLTVSVHANTRQFNGNGYATDYNASPLYFELNGWYDESMKINATMSLYGQFSSSSWSLVRTDYIHGSFDETGHLYDLTDKLLEDGIVGCDAYVNLYLQSE